MTVALYMTAEQEAQAEILATTFFKSVGENMPAAALEQPAEQAAQTQLAFCIQALIGSAYDASGLTVTGAMQGIGLAIGAVLAAVPNAPTRALLVAVIENAANTALHVNGRIHNSQGNA